VAPDFPESVKSASDPGAGSHFGDHVSLKFCLHSYRSQSNLLYLLNIDNLYLLIMFFRLVLLIAVFSVAFANEFLSNARDNFRSLTKDHVSIATETSSIHHELNIISKS
jgi:hypothetical protein